MIITVAVGKGSSVANLMRQYSLAVESASLFTSACLLVPRWPHAKFNHLLKGISVLTEYPALMLSIPSSCTTPLQWWYRLVLRLFNELVGLQDSRCPFLVRWQVIDIKQ